MLIQDDPMYHHKVGYGSIWLLLHVLFTHCYPIWKTQTVKLVLKLRDLASVQPININGLQTGHPCLGHHGHWNPMLLGDGFYIADLSRRRGGIADFLCFQLYVNRLCPSKWDGSPTTSCLSNGLKTTMLQRNGWPSTVQQQERKTRFWGPVYNLVHSFSLLVINSDDPW